MDEKNIPDDVLKRYLSNTCTPQEKSWVESWFLKEVDQAQHVPLDIPTLEKRQDLLKRRLLEKHLHVTERKTVVWKIWATSVAACLTICTGIYYYLSVPAQQYSAPTFVTEYRDIPAAQDLAILITSGGDSIALDKLSPGTSIQEGLLHISKNMNGEIQYQASTQDSPSSHQAYNTIFTPKGTKYKIVLSDGTKVWLNAGATLRFPVHFALHERRVKLQGEAYFDVTHQEAQSSTKATLPFIVETNRQDIKVLGTQFNVSAYVDDDEETTTLIKGKVEVTAFSDQSRDHRIGKETLFPNQQAQLSNRLMKQIVDVSSDIAWVNGDFLFNKESLSEIMKKIGRWYNVDVHFENNVGNLQFSGAISRKQHLSAVLQMLKATNQLDFTVERSISDDTVKRIRITSKK
ncbi:FecR family protein [Sphingobacterium sp. SYP-B4668]|uniref:FecR family protein n=1 Tax=Sphingobacterium sp. SYP-B4668 TaxID=2996035 RepID=UPI0022DE746B|nr:FecR family protein [Sphingobacterium sp. SYP-B4668]